MMRNIFVYPIVGIILIIAMTILIFFHQFTWLTLPIAISCCLLLIGIGSLLQHQYQIEHLLSQQNRLLIAMLKSKGVEIE